MGGGQPMGQLARLLAVAILFSCGQLVHCKKGYFQEGDRIWCTLGVTGEGGDPCAMMQYVFPDSLKPAGCYAYLTTPQSLYTVYTMSLKFDSVLNPIEEAYLSGILDPNGFGSAYPDNKYWPNTLKCYDIDECAEGTNRCSPNAACYDKFFGYTCECLDGFIDNSLPPYTGYRCERERPPPPPQDDGLELELWVYILIGIACFVVLMLVFCCCCFYSSDSCCGGHGIKHVRHVRVLPDQPKEKKIVIEIEKEDPALSGHSAFIANSGYDGKVYVAPQPCLPWHAGQGNALNPPQIQVLDAPQPMQVIQQPEVQYIQQPAVQVLQPMVQQCEPTMLQSGDLYSDIGTMMIQ